jgi:hypothetical protein
VTTTQIKRLARELCLDARTVVQYLEGKREPAPWLRREMEALGAFDQHSGGHRNLGLARHDPRSRRASHRIPPPPPNGEDGDRQWPS